MNEEQAVLDFFSQQENLPLTLAVADQTDNLRRNMNNEFWSKLAEYAERIAPEWLVQITEDQNIDDCLVGLHLRPRQEQPICLYPMLEQQVIGETPRIYCGLIWSNTPGPHHLEAPEIKALCDILENDGFKNNDKFLAWQWTSFFPRSKNFLLRFSSNQEKLLDEAIGLLQHFVITRGQMLNTANAALASVAPSAVISLDNLRNKLKP
jgi:hypothetical protein